MKINTRLKKYVELNGNVVKDYPQMCRILKEDETTGSGKISQIKRWKLYFDFEKKGHKFIITDIYDEKTVKKNQKLNANNYITARSKYRNKLVPILLYLLSISNDNSLFGSKLDVAIWCGFFNEEIKGKSKFDKYKQYRDELISKFPDIPYYTVDMDKFIYCTYYNHIKRCAYRIILGALNELKKIKVIDYNIVNVGIKYNPNEPQIYELFEDENRIYKQCVEEACKEVLPLYNSVTKNKKEKVTPADFIFRETVRESYYDILNQLVSKKLGYDIIMEYLKINLTKNMDDIEDVLKMFNVCNEFSDSLEMINNIFVSSMRASIDKIIISSKNFHIYSRMISFDSKEHYATLKQGKDEKKQEVSYYNKMEILNTLVSTKGDMEIMNLGEFEEKYYDCTWIENVTAEGFSKLNKCEEETEEDSFDEEDESRLQEILECFYN